MVLSDISIQRPVFATVMSLLLIALGIMSWQTLTVRELPDIDPPIVSVDASYPGASAAVVETRVTQVLEDAVSGIEGILSLESRSRNGSGSVSIEFSLNREIEAATNDVRDAISRVVGRLPPEVDPPRVQKVEADARPILWLNMASERMDTLELTDYAERYVADRLSAVEGVAAIRVGGQQRYAMRVWLDNEALAARGLTVSDVENALRRENVELPAGALEGQARDFTLRMNRAFQAPEEFAALRLAQGEDGFIVRLGDVARVERGSADRRAYFRSNGQSNIGLGVVRTSTSNALDVAQAIRAEAERVRPTLPEGTDIFVAFDSTIFIEASIDRVYRTLIEALVLVLIVIYLFLGSVRAALIPAVTVPICLVAAFIGLAAFGFSINLLTLLALVLCIGLVVDDAIVVLENNQRRADLGEPPIVAAKRGTAQVAFAVIATTAVLVAVFLPVAFMQSNAGRLFRELSVALAGAVVISSFVALTLTPMMCSKLIRPNERPSGINAWFQSGLKRLSAGYGRQIAWVVRHTPRWRVGALAVVFGAAIASVVGLFNILPKELTPDEDRGTLFVMVQGPEGAGFDYTVEQMRDVERIMYRFIGEDGPLERVNTRVPGGFGASEEMHTGMAIVFMKDWRERTMDTGTMVDILRAEFNQIPGVRAFAQGRGGGLGGGGGQPLQFVLGGPDYQELAEWRDRMLERIEENPNIFGADSDFRETRPQIRIDVDPVRAADLGVSVQEVGRTLETMMGSRRVTTYVDGGEEYDVILQAEGEFRASPADLFNLYVRSERSGQLVPLSNLVTLTEVAEPGSFNRYNRLRAITISANLAGGYSLGEAVQWVQDTARAELPEYAQLDYKGQTREFMRASGSVAFTFIMALLVVYLVLAAQFESFLHPIVIMFTVPMAVLGAMLGLWITGGSLNLFSQIGIVMLVGLAAKNGILMVEFANQLRDAGREVSEAIIEAAGVRLRPILMTSVATIAGAIPLVVAGGPGSASRATIGVVIITGVAFSSLLSLYVIPAFYSLLAPFTRSPMFLTRKLEQLETRTPTVGGHA